MMEPGCCAMERFWARLAKWLPGGRVPSILLLSPSLPDPERCVASLYDSHRKVNASHDANPIRDLPRSSNVVAPDIACNDDGVCRGGDSSPLRRQVALVSHALVHPQWGDQTAGDNVAVEVRRWRWRCLCRRPGSPPTSYRMVGVWGFPVVCGMPLTFERPDGTHEFTVHFHPRRIPLPTNQITRTAGMKM